MSWKCPECGSSDLVVMVLVAAALTQHPDGAFETDADGDHEWDGCSSMTCTDCNYCAASASFEVTP